MEKLEIKEEAIENRLKTIDNFSLSISEKPNEKDIISIIEFVEKVEISAGRFKQKPWNKTIKDAIKNNYTSWACYDLAIIILKAFNLDKEMFLVKFAPTSVATFGFGGNPDFHYLVQFGDNFYDINGKHSSKDLVGYLKSFSWVGDIKIREKRQLDPKEAEIKDIVEKFCLEHINISKQQKEKPGKNIEKKSPDKCLIQ